MVSRMLVETRDATQFDEKVEATSLCHRCKIGWFASARYLPVNHVGWIIEHLSDSPIYLKPMLR
jgi:hypothetical protein